MNSVTYDIVAKLWNLCNVLKDDGVTYHQYVTELTYLLFLKMAKETGTESQLPKGYKWDDLENKSIDIQIDFYKILLIHLGSYGSELVKEIFANANTFIKKPTTLAILTNEINKLNWYSIHREQLGDLYEGLLEKNANEKKSGAGQYFTPRSLIDSMIALTQPQLGDIIQDPAAGTGGFLISASHYIKEHSNQNNWTQDSWNKYYNNTFYGMEHVQDTQRLSLMNMLLHGLNSGSNSAGIIYGDTLSTDSENLPKASLILSNPPFGTKKGGGLPNRDDLPYPTSNKQLCFLQHIYGALKAGGRAAVIVPDNVLFDNNIGRQVRADLMNKCNLHTILKLPTGIFYAQGVKTNVLFFTKGSSDKNNTKEIWVYDLRTNIPAFSKRSPLNRTFFKEFEVSYGTDPVGFPSSLAKRMDTGEHGRFRCFTRTWISEHQDSLDISWLQETSVDDPLDPTELIQIAVEEIEIALLNLRNILIEAYDEVDNDA